VVALARVTQDIDEPRGPDVVYSIEVPARWLEVGATVQLQLPRLLSCARCQGGGCDSCERRGAFEQLASGIPSELALTLPRQAAGPCSTVCLRLPASGARAAADSELPSGHLLLTVLPRDPTPDWAPASSLVALDLPEPRSKWLQPPLLWLWAAALGLLLLLFSIWRVLVHRG
jgi:hypothetical protein